MGTGTDEASRGASGQREGWRSGARAGRQSAVRFWRRRGRAAVLLVALLLSALPLLIVAAAYRDDVLIESDMGRTTAEVYYVSSQRTLIRFTTSSGQLYEPPNGVLYPRGLQEGQVVRIQYDRTDPDLVRVAGRGGEQSLLPAAAVLAGVWVIFGPALYWLHRRSRAGAATSRR